MNIELVNKEDNTIKYDFKCNEKNIIILNGLLYDLTNDEAKRFYSGEYMMEYLKDIKEGYEVDEFYLGSYVINAPFSLENYFLNIK